MNKIFKLLFKDKYGKEHTVSYFGTSEEDVRKLFHSVKRKGDVLISIERTF